MVSVLGRKMQREWLIVVPTLTMNREVDGHACATRSLVFGEEFDIDFARVVVILGHLKSVKTKTCRGALACYL